jgi:hypothetical protein
VPPVNCGVAASWLLLMPVFAPCFLGWVRNGLPYRFILLTGYYKTLKPNRLLQNRITYHTMQSVGSGKVKLDNQHVSNNYAALTL